MKRKLFVIMIAASMVMTMATGCGGEKKTEQTVESIEEKEPVTAVTFTGETAFTAVQGEAAAFSDLISKAEVESGYNPETVDNYDFDIYASNVQSKAGDDSNIKAVSVKDSNVEFQKPGHYTVTYEVTFRKPIKVDVPVKDETNTSDKSDASEDITSVEIPTDVAVVGKDEEDDVEADDIIRENVKPETGDKEETTADKENSSETKSNEKTSSGSSSSSSKNGSSESSASSSGSSSSGSSSSGGSSSGSSASSGSSGSSGAGSSGAASASHTHSWKEHTAKRWVSNMVTVVDTPAQTVYGAQLYTKNADGTWTSNGAIYWFENGFTRDDLGAIIKDKMKDILEIT